MPRVSRFAESVDVSQYSPHVPFGRGGEESLGEKAAVANEMMIRTHLDAAGFISSTMARMDCTSDFVAVDPSELFDLADELRYGRLEAA